MRIFLKSLFVSFISLIAANPVLAEAAAAPTGEKSLGAAIAIGVAALGGGLAISKSAAGAVDAIARNPGAAGQMFLPWLLSYVFIEAMVILAFVIALSY